MEILRHRLSDVVKVIVAEGCKFDSLLEAELLRGGGQGLSIEHVSRQALDRICPGVHQGIVCYLSAQEFLAWDDFVNRVVISRKSGVLLALDQVTDPQNFGSLLRAAEAFGVDGVLFPEARSCPLTPAVVKASAGASELVLLCRVKNLRRSLLQLKDCGYWVAGAFLGQEAKDICCTDLPSPLVLVLGAEGRGLRELTAATCDMLVQIPMDGRIESLNVSQSASVFLFELMRRRKLRNVREG